MKNCIQPKIMAIKPNLNLKKSCNGIWRNVQNETVGQIGVWLTSIIIGIFKQSMKMVKNRFTWLPLVELLLYTFTEVSGGV